MSKINAIKCSYFENTTKRNVSNIKNLWGVVARTNLDGLLVITYGLNVHFIRRLHRFQYTTIKIFNLAMCILIKVHTFSYKHIDSTTGQKHFIVSSSYNKFIFFDLFGVRIVLTCVHSNIYSGTLICLFVPFVSKYIYTDKNHI